VLNASNYKYWLTHFYTSWVFMAVIKLWKCW